MSGTAAPATTKLYSPRLLALSAELANFPLNSDFLFAVEARSRTCGSSLKLGLACDSEGAVTRIGMQVSACAVGQGSAAILARSIQGKNSISIVGMLDQINRWFGGDGTLPDWPDFDALSAVQNHPGRHGALLLPWKAAHEVLSSGSTAG